MANCNYGGMGCKRGEIQSETFLFYNLFLTFSYKKYLPLLTMTFHLHFTSEIGVHVNKLVTIDNYSESVPLDIFLKFSVKHI